MILESILAAFSGGATGLVGSLITDVTGYFKQKKEFEHEQALRELDIKYLNAEAEASIMVAKSETERAKIESKGRVDEAEATAFIEAQKSDANIIESAALAKKSSKLLNTAAFTRTMVRPVLTLYLCIMSTLMYVDARNTLESVDLNEATAQTISVYGDISNNLIYLSSAAVLFWFGQRKKTK